MRSARATGSSFPLLDPNRIEPFISRLAIKMSMGAPLSENQEEQLDQIKLILEVPVTLKRQKTQGNQASSASVSTLPTGGSAAMITQPGKIFRPCVDFQRPAGCSRAVCQMDHILVLCAFHPKCTKDATVCRFHHG